jgi:signal transduction histidine kinase
MSMGVHPESGRKTRELLITTSPILAGGERLVLLLVEDITVNDELEKALQRSEKLAMTGRLIATLAHELNNPLESLSNLLYLLKLKPELGQSAKELVESAEQEVAILGTITRQTLAPHRVARLPVITKLSELLDEVVTLFQPALESAGIKVRREYQTEGEASIYPGEFRQVFTNLIANAIDAMESGGELCLSIEKSPGGKVIVRIRDNGCGIPPENLNSIFEPFFTTKGEKGTGIGLWVVKNSVEKVGGKIEVTSSEADQRGTCLTIVLPAPDVVPMDLYEVL